MIRNSSVLNHLTQRELYGSKNIQEYCDKELYSLHGHLHVEHSTGPTSHVSKFATNSLCHPRTLATSHDDGFVNICLLQPLKKELPIDCTKRLHRNVVYDLAWMPASNKLLTGSGDESLGLFDVVSVVPREVRRYTCFNSSVRRLSPCQENPSIFAAACFSGVISIFDIRDHSPGPSNIIHNDMCAGQFRPNDPKVGVRLKDVCFLNDCELMSCAIPDGGFSFWDTRKLYSFAGSKTVAVRHIKNPTEGCFTNLLAHPSGNYIYASNHIPILSKGPSMIYRYRRNESTFDCKFNGAIFDSWSRLSLSPDGAYLMSGSATPDACMWRADLNPDQISRPSRELGVLPITLLRGHHTPIVSVSWCQGPETVIVAQCDSNERMIFSLPWHKWGKERSDMCSNTKEVIESPDTVKHQKTVFKTSHLLNDVCIRSRLPRPKGTVTPGHKRRAPLSPRKLVLNRNVTLAVSKDPRRCGQGENTDWLQRLQQKSAEKAALSPAGKGARKFSNSRKEKGKTFKGKSLEKYLIPKSEGEAACSKIDIIPE